MKHMIEKDYSLTDVENMRETLCQEGWTESLMLPDAWKYRRTKQSRCLEFVSKKGELLNLEEARQKIKEDPFYTEKEECNFDTFTDIKPEKADHNLCNDWIESDETLPKGWKSRVENSKHIIFHQMESLSEQQSLLSNI